ncbi:hypothetical protein Tco_0953277 [Tanacetum coccineum]|uniref:Uncharacterized protein n=1 Tax=Tanacetum coccineum TaxID=301880 RepID=A0ABQ5DZF5_9ASTR
MAISVISGLSDSLEESVGTSTREVILFGTIPTTIPDTTPSVIPPSTHIDTTLIPTVSPTIPPLPDYTPASPDYSPASDTEFDPSEDPSSDHIPPLPATLPFLLSTDDSSDNDIPDTPPSPNHGIPFTETTLSTRVHLLHLVHFDVESWFLHLDNLFPMVDLDYSSSDHFSSDDSSRDLSSSSSLETSSDSSADALSDSASSVMALGHVNASLCEVVSPITVAYVLSDSLEESVGTSTREVILFGTIPTTIPDTTPSVIPPSTHIDTTPIPTVSPTIPPLPDYTPASPDYSPVSDTEFDPSEDSSSDQIPPLPATSPFLSSTDDSSDNDIPDTPPSPNHGTPFTETTLSTRVHLLHLVHFDVESWFLHLDNLFPMVDHTATILMGRSLESATDLDGYLEDNFEPYVPREAGLGWLKSDGIDIDPEIQAEIDECIAYTNAFSDRGIDARPVVEAIDREEIEMGVRGLVEVKVDRVTHPVVIDDIPEPA